LNTWIGGGPTGKVRRASSLVTQYWEPRGRSSASLVTQYGFLSHTVARARFLSYTRSGRLPDGVGLLDNARGGLPMAFERTCVHKDIPGEGLGVSGGELVGALGTSSRTVERWRAGPSRRPLRMRAARRRGGAVGSMIFSPGTRARRREFGSSRNELGGKRGRPDHLSTNNNTDK